MDQLKQFVKTGNAAGTAERVQVLLGQGKDPEAIMKSALIPAMDEVGDLFSQGKYFVPEMLIAGRAMQKGLEVLKPRLMETGIKAEGKVLIGTVRGDLHDIGKNRKVPSW
jgi:5-methyltetrahydrofolate--homocysteine methyltransferase